MYTHFFMVDSVRMEFFFAKGFYKACTSKLVDDFSGQDLKLALEGREQVDWDDIEKSAKYENVAFQPKRPIAQEF